MSVSCMTCGGVGKMYAPTSRPCTVCHGTGRVEMHADAVAAQAARGRRDAAVTSEDLAHLHSGAGGETRAMNDGRRPPYVRPMPSTCEHCGVELRRWKHRSGTGRAFSVETLAQVPTADGRPPKLGVHGCNAFCSVRCGFDWAVSRLRRGGET